jgi:hypothetical protein
MTELKRCPFCGSIPRRLHVGGVVCNNNCKNIAVYPEDTWNTRPIEDELNARIKELEEVITAKDEIQWRLEEVIEHLNSVDHIVISAKNLGCNDPRTR